MEIIETIKDLHCEFVAFDSDSELREYLAAHPCSRNAGRLVLVTSKPGQIVRIIVHHESELAARTAEQAGLVRSMYARGNYARIVARKKNGPSQRYLLMQAEAARQSAMRQAEVDGL